MVGEREKEFGKTESCDTDEDLGRGVVMTILRHYRRSGMDKRGEELREGIIHGLTSNAMIAYMYLRR